MLNAQTLCSTYGGQTPNYTVGVGSPNNIINSSQLGSSLPNGSVVSVVGDFTIDANFSLTNAVVKVNTGKKILVQFSDYVNFNTTTLVLNNTKVFACTGLWKGIEMGGLTGITTTNGTKIEDAENAIKALNSGMVSLSIDNTTFNRNVIGINLDASTLPWYVMPPIFNYFTNNAFSCTSALNGSLTGVTNFGVQMVNINYPFAFNYGNYNNTFTGIKNGIFMNAAYGVMELNNYHFEAIVNACVYFVNGEQLNVKNSTFNDVKAYGIRSEIVRTLTVEDCQFSGSYSELPASVIENRFMIFVTDPKVGNSNLIQRNEFKTFDDLYNYNFFHIQFWMYDGATHDLNAQITGNTFKQFNNTNVTNGPDIGSSTAIQILGNCTSGSNVGIGNNDFILDANNTGTIKQINRSIDIRNGDKNNIHIVGNRFKSGHGKYCLLVGSAGTGNEFSNNIFELGQSKYLADGLFLNNFQNAKVCSNIDYNASSGYLINGQNYNTNFVRNITYGANPVSMRFGFNDPLIGPQIHKGNEWYPEFCLPPFSNSTCHPYILHDFPNSNLLLLSQFKVHTSQSVLNPNNNVYSYFSKYFPYYVVPNATPSGFWVIDPNGSPATDCATPGPNSGGLSENFIAQNGLSDYLRNPIQQYDAEMYLYRSIKANPNAFNGNRSYNSFLQRNNGKNKDKFTDLEKAIDESDEVKEVTKNKVAAFREQIKALETEAKRYNKDNRASFDVMQAWYKKRLDLDDNINTLYKEHKAEKKIKHQNAKRIIDNVVPTAANERLIKDVYVMYLDAQINNDGKFTVEQTVRMKIIAQTCVTEGGMIVYVARGLLSRKDLQDIQKTIDVCEPELIERVEGTPPSNSVQQKQVASTTIFPNPAGESFTINIADNLTAIAQVTDIVGKIVKVYNLQTGTNTIRHNLPKGIYIINIKMSDGKILTEKLSINY
jgi:Secretion system C-terminal sorting domain